MIIKPYDLNVIKLQDLIDKKLVLETSSSNKPWRATIFPLTTELNNLSYYDKDHLITQLDDSIFKDFTILSKINQNVSINNGEGRKFIKSIVIGDFTDSIKRYTNLEKPIDYNINAQETLKIPVKHEKTYTIPIEKNLIYKQGLDTSDFQILKKSNIFIDEINHPHISRSKTKPTIYKENNKTLIMEVLKWGLNKGIKYIYCINEHRPNMFNQQYVTPYVYYTITGSY